MLKLTMQIRCLARLRTEEKEWTTRISNYNKKKNPQRVEMIY